MQNTTTGQHDIDIGLSCDVSGVFPKSFRKFRKDFRNLQSISEILNISETTRSLPKSFRNLQNTSSGAGRRGRSPVWRECSSEGFRRFPRVSEGFRRFPKVSEDFRRYPNISEEHGRLLDCFVNQRSHAARSETVQYRPRSPSKLLQTSPHDS